MKFEISNTQKKSLGYMIKVLRLEANLNQQQLLDANDHVISLRSFISLEKGNAIKSDDVYDTILNVFALKLCYDEKLLQALERDIYAIFDAYQNYDALAYQERCHSFFEQWKNQKQYVQVYFVYQAMLILEDLSIHKEFIDEEGYRFLTRSFSCYNKHLQMMIGEAIYRFEYQHAHRNETLEMIYTLHKPLQSLLCTRFCMVLVLHMLDKQRDYLHAYLLLLKLEKNETRKGTKNEHIWFSIMQWKANVEVHILPNEFVKQIEKCEAMLQQNHFSKNEQTRFLQNTAVNFYRQKEYAKARDYYEKMMAFEQEYRLPQLIWYYNMQYYVDKTLPAYREVDVSNCSEQLQVCWHYFVLKQKGTDAHTLENYIMKTVLPYLKNMDHEFAKVYFVQLSDLVKETRNYRTLSQFLEKLSLLAFI